jgi:SOS response regulatory protein OraA/RecX
MSATSSELENVDFEASCAALVRKKYGRVPDDSHERELMYASLMRMGYSSSEIKKALKLLN